MVKKSENLEKLTSGIKFIEVVSFCIASEVVLGFGNEVYQQIKHLSYHLRNIGHKRKNCPSDASFSYYARFQGENKQDLLE